MAAARFPGRLRFGLQELVPASKNAIRFYFLSLDQLKLVCQYVLLPQ